MPGLISVRWKLRCWVAIMAALACTSSLAGAFAPGAVTTIGHGAAAGTVLAGGVSVDPGPSGIESGHEPAIEFEDSEPEVSVRSTRVCSTPRTEGWRVARPSAIADRIDEGEPNPD